MRAQGGRGGITLPGTLLALRGHRHRSAARRDAGVGVRRQGRGVHVHRSGLGVAVLMDQSHGVVAGRAPDSGVRGHGQVQFAGDLERLLLGKARIAGDVEGDLEALEIAGATVEELAELRCARPVRRRVLDVAVGQHEPARHRGERVDRGVGMVDRLQAVRPVHAGGDPGVERLQRAEEVPGVDVLGSELRAPVQVVPDEVLRERPVRTVAAGRGLPHVPVRVDHPGHDDAAAGVDLVGAVGNDETDADGGDPAVDHEHVVAVEHGAGGIHGEDGPAAEHGRTADGVRVHGDSSNSAARQRFQARADELPTFSKLAPNFRKFNSYS